MQGSSRKRSRDAAATGRSPTRYDAAEYLRTADDAAHYLNAALELADPAVFAKALGDIARSRGMSDLSRSTGLTRESLYRTLSAEGNPQLDTLLRVLDALDVRLVVTTGGRAKGGSDGRAARAPARKRAPTGSPRAAR